MIADDLPQTFGAKYAVTDEDTSQSPWMTPEQTAIYLSIAIGTLRNWTSQRYIPFARRGRVVRYHRREVDKWLARGSCKGRASIADLPACENE
jgi:excisionase family DNA binding protein